MIISQQGMQSVTLPPVHKIFQSYKKNSDVVSHTLLQRSTYLSNLYQANIYIKREDMQVVRSFKIRGAAQAMRHLTAQQRALGVVTASAGNHAQGVAFCCNKLQIKGTIFMPQKTPFIKVNSVKTFGKEYVQVFLVGNTFDEALTCAKEYQEANGAVFIHAFDNMQVIIGQGGMACEILEDWKEDTPIDYLFSCVGGGGLISGVGSYFKELSPQTQVVGFEPLGSPSMYQSLKKGEPVQLIKIDTFVDGAAIKKAAKLTFDIIRKLGLKIMLVPEGQVATTMLDIYNYQSLVIEPAGSLAIAGLELMKEEIKGKSVVCIASGSNNEISRLPEIQLRSRIYKQIQAFYMIKIGDVGSTKLRKFIGECVVKEQEDIIMLSFTKKTQTPGNCMIGLQFMDPKFKGAFEHRLKQSKYEYVAIGPDSILFSMLKP